MPSAAPTPRLPADPTRPHPLPPPLRIVTWNIGLRGLQKLCAPPSAASAAAVRADVHGIRRAAAYGSLAALLERLDADVVCLQEVKLRELGAAERQLALADGWESYFALCRTRSASTVYGRYAGVATFCRAHVRPQLAEEGVTGVHAVAGCAVGHAEEVRAAYSPEEQRMIDCEGRCLLSLHGDLALFNVYVPAITADDAAQAERRAEMKAAFLDALDRRARALLAAGLRVLLLGDFNIAPQPVDSARELQQMRHGEPSPSRAWLSRLLSPSARPPLFVDTFRALHPHARDAYTCFHVAAGADAFNFGSRIDLALLAPPPRLDASFLAGGVLLERCEIDATVRGSDHLPLRLQLRGVTLPRHAPALPLSSRVRLAGQGVLDGFRQAAAAPPPADGGPTHCTHAPHDPPRCAHIPHVPPRSTRTTHDPLSNTHTPHGLPHARDMPQRGLRAFFQRDDGGEAAGVLEERTADAAEQVSDEVVAQVRHEVENQQKTQAAAWQTLLKRVDDVVPRCSAHRERCRVQTVKKAGANQGRQFYSCPRAEGPRSNPAANCGFFQWASERSAELKRKRGHS